MMMFNNAECIYKTEEFLIRRFYVQWQLDFEKYMKNFVVQFSLLKQWTANTNLSIKEASIVMKVGYLVFGMIKLKTSLLECLLCWDNTFNSNNHDS